MRAGDFGFQNATLVAESPSTVPDGQFRRRADLSGVDFMGFQFDPLDLDSAVRIVASRASSGGAFQYVVTPNAAIAVRAARSPNCSRPCWMALR